MADIPKHRNQALRQVKKMCEERKKLLLSLTKLAPDHANQEANHHHHNHFTTVIDQYKDANLEMSTYVELCNNQQCTRAVMIAENFFQNKRIKILIIISTEFNPSAQLFFRAQTNKQKKKD